MHFIRRADEEAPPNHWYAPSKMQKTNASKTRATRARTCSFFTTKAMSARKKGKEKKQWRKTAMSSLHLTRKAIWMSCHQLPAFTMFVVKTVILSIKLLWKHRVFRANTHSYTNKSHFAPKIVRFFVACLNEISWKLRENVTSILLSQSNDLRCSISIWLAPWPSHLKNVTQNTENGIDVRYIKNGLTWS